MKVKKAIQQEESGPVYDLRRQLAVERVKSRRAQKEVAHWQQETERVEHKFNVALSLGQYTTSAEIKPRHKGGKSETHAMLFGCDWHSEEKVDPATINGLNEHNLELADRKINNLFRNGLYLINLWRAGTTIKELTIAFLGDLMTGHIHDEYKEVNQLSPMETVLWNQDRIISGLHFLLNHGKFEKIHYVGGFGNHDRDTKRKQHATAYKHSYDWMMHHQIAKVFKGEPKITFTIGTSYHTYKEIYGRDVRMSHGDYLNYREGIGGIAVPANKAVQKWDESRRAWLDIFGHWHQFNHYGNWISCNCLIGYNPFALKIKAPCTPPSQTLVFIEKDKTKPTGVLEVFV